MKRVITIGEVPERGELRVPAGTIFTPAARDLVNERGVRVREYAAEEFDALATPEKTVAIGADHGGFALKEQLKPIIESYGLTVRDVGVYEEKPADYPDLALAVARLVADGTAARGIVVDGAGIGSCMAANKVPGVRAALCYDQVTARNSREHNDSNVLTLGAKVPAAAQSEIVVRTWLETAFGGGRHQARVDKIIAIERSYLKS